MHVPHAQRHRARYVMTMEEDWVWLPHKAAVPAVYMAISVSAPKTSALL